MESIKFEQNVELGVVHEADLTHALLQEQIDDILEKTEFILLPNGIIKELNLRLREVQGIVEDGVEFEEYARVLGVDLEEVEFPGLLPVEAVSLLSEVEWSLRVEGDYLHLKIPLPGTLFKEKDYLQNIYPFKKYCYLKTVARALETSEEVSEMQVVFWRGDFRSPVLEFNFTTDNGLKQKILLMPYLLGNVFPARRFLMEQNNLRKCRDKDSQLKSTPYYNLSILRDLTLLPNLQYLDNTFDLLKYKTSVRDALKLIKIWSRCHRLDSQDGFNDLTWILVVLRGIQRGQISQDNSSLSVFHGILCLLKSTKNLNKISKESEETWKDSEHHFLKLVPSDQKPNFENFKKLKMQCVVDVTGHFNLAWDVADSWLTHLKMVSKRTLLMMESNEIKSQEMELFTCRLPLRGEFDSVVEFELPQIHTQYLLKNDRSYLRARMERVETVVKEGLGNRCLFVRVLWNPTNTRISVHQHLSQCIPVSICLVFSPEHGGRLVDRGPSPEVQEAAREFRAFWGKKSELKKFPDGTICEAVSWEFHSDLQISEQIILHLLNLHFSLKSKPCSLAGAYLGNLQDSSTEYRRLHQAFQKVNTLLKDLKGLALKINSVQEVDPVFRKTVCFSPIYHPLADELELSDEVDSLPRCLIPAEILVYLESSGSWPVHEEAYQKTKTAINAQLSLLLSKQGHHSKAHHEFTDLFFQGFVFRIHLTTERDERVDSNEFTLRRKYHGLVSQVANQNAAFAGTCRLLQRWVSFHCFDFHFNPVVWELLSLYIYVQKTTKHQPATPIAGFFRVLDLICSFPWQQVPLIIDPANDLTEEEIKKMEGWYSQDGGHCLLAISTSFDRTSSLTNGRPSEKSIFSRLIHLAHQTLHQEVHDLREIFLHNLSGFDVILHLNKEALPHPAQAFLPQRAVKKQKLNYSEGIVISNIPGRVLESFSAKKIRSQLVVGFNPVYTFHQILQREFSAVGIFCCDQFAGDMIAIRWKSHALQPTSDPDFSQLAYWLKTTVGYIPDTASILTDIKSIGQGLVEQIEIL